MAQALGALAAAARMFVIKIFEPGCQPPLPGHSTSRYRQDNPKELTAASKIAPQCPLPLIRKEKSIDELSRRPVRGRSQNMPATRGARRSRPHNSARRESTAYSGVALVAAMSTTVCRIAQSGDAMHRQRRLADRPSSMLRSPPARRTHSAHPEASPSGRRGPQGPQGAVATPIEWGWAVLGASEAPQQRRINAKRLVHL
jgi:hypothetical protein